MTPDLRHRRQAVNEICDYAGLTRSRFTPPPTPFITGITADGLGNFVISGTADQNGKVVLWKSTGLAATGWLAAGTNAVTSGTTFTFTVPQGADPTAFFRMQGL